MIELALSSVLAQLLEEDRQLFVSVFNHIPVEEVLFEGFGHSNLLLDCSNLIVLQDDVVVLPWPHEAGVDVELVDVRCRMLEVVRVDQEWPLVFQVLMQVLVPVVSELKRFLFQESFESELDPGLERRVSKLVLQDELVGERQPIELLLSLWINCNAVLLDSEHAGRSEVVCLAGKKWPIRVV